MHRTKSVRKQIMQELFVPKYKTFIDMFIIFFLFSTNKSKYYIQEKIEHDHCNNLRTYLQYEKVFVPKCQLRHWSISYPFYSDTRSESGKTTPTTVTFNTENGPF